MNKILKTIVIWEESDTPLKFFILDGDYRNLDDVHINSCSDAELENELISVVYDNCETKVAMLKKFPNIFKQFPDTAVIVCGHW